MVVSILALVVLILVTPILLGRPPSELASLPLLIIGMSRNESAFIVSVGAAVQAYRYDFIRLSTNGTSPSANVTQAENDTYGFHVWILANGTFTVHAYFVDQQRNYFEYNVTVHTEKNLQGDTVIVLTFPLEEDNPPAERRTPPEDYRRFIPLRGTVPP